ncbi:T-cell differentiation antigen CD6 isoform X2 [Ambystoma mexicanum]|uniref:T-cell differentiation antigen CD6 isoform X2 n=1 Tax=Ambystoma mexicanum TaxID=8296 RepID=UPI0037E8192B
MVLPWAMSLLGISWLLLPVIVALALEGVPRADETDNNSSPTTDRTTTKSSEWTRITNSAGKKARLVNGTGPCSGRMEVRHQDHWMPVCQESRDRNASSVLCSELGCGAAIGWVEEPERATGLGILKNGAESSGVTLPPPNRNTNSFLWVLCAHGEGPLQNCVVTPSPCRSGRPAELNCTAQRGVRLVDGPSPCSGRVEVEGNVAGSWGTVCDDSWDLSEGHVVCRQLGCGSAIKTFGEAHFGKGNGPIHLDEMNCSGSEASLWDCPADLSTDCGHKEDAGVICSDSLGLMPVTAVAEPRPTITTNSALVVTGTVGVRDHGINSPRTNTLLILCILLSLMLFGTWVVCSLFISRMRRTQSMVAQDPREDNLRGQGTPVLLNHSLQSPALLIAQPHTETSFYQDTPSNPPKSHDSLRYIPIEGTAEQKNMVEMETLQEDTTPIQHCTAQSDTIRVSSNEDYGNSTPRRKNSRNSFPYPESRKVAPGPSNTSYAGTQLSPSGSPVQQHPDSSSAHSENTWKPEHLDNGLRVPPLLIGPAPCPHDYSKRDEDSTSTSSGEEDWYQNWKPPPHSPAPVDLQPFSGKAAVSPAPQEGSSD